MPSTTMTGQGRSERLHLPAIPQAHGGGEVRSQTREGAVMQGDTLKEVIRKHQTELEQELNVNSLLLKYLQKHGLVSKEDVKKLEGVSSQKFRRKMLIECILSSSSLPPHCYTSFLEALRHSHHGHLLTLMSSVEREIVIVGQYQNMLHDHLQDVNQYLSSEGRRTQQQFDSGGAETLHNNEAASVPPDLATLDRQTVLEFLYRVHTTTKTTLQQFDRCREVIEKLHKDCELTDKSNNDMLGKLRDCEKLVLKLVPSHLAVKRPRKEQEHQTGTIPEDNDVHRKSEATEIMENIKNNISTLQTEIRGNQGQINNCLQIIQNMSDDISDRRRSLLKARGAVAPSSVRTDKYSDGIPEMPENKQKSRVGVMREKLQELGKEVACYTHQERQSTQQAVVASYDGLTFNPGLDRGGYPPVNLHTSSLHQLSSGAIESDLEQLQRDIQHGDKDRALTALSRLITKTKTERRDFLRILEDIQNTINTRVTKLGDITGNRTASRPTVVGKRKHLGKVTSRPRLTKNSQSSSFSEKLSEIQDAVKSLIDLELQQSQFNRAEVMKKKQTFDAETKGKTFQIRDLQRRLHEAETQRDRFRKRYSQERAANILTKPIIPKRDGRTRTTPSTHAVGGTSARARPRVAPRAPNLARIKQVELEKRVQSRANAINGGVPTVHMSKRPIVPPIIMQHADDKNTN